MEVLKCKMCGGNILAVPGLTIGRCDSCGTNQTLPELDGSKKLSLFQRANALRKNCAFDRAAAVYETIVAEYPQEAEAYWGLLLCSFGIEYVDDPASGNKIPTCHRSSYESVLKNSNYHAAIQYARPEARGLYEAEAAAIDALQKDLISISAKEAPCDIFICYKETDPQGKRTLDSLLAQDLYDALTREGYRVFFSRISLEDKLGTEYEPYIFAALNSARVMLAVGTRPEHYQAVWVRNEWSRFLRLMTPGSDKYLFPCYKNMDPYSLPEEFARLQGKDLGEIGAVQDILRNLKKIFPSRDATRSAPAAPSSTGVVFAAPSRRTAKAALPEELEEAGMLYVKGGYSNGDKACNIVMNHYSCDIMAAMDILNKYRQNHFNRAHRHAFYWPAHWPLEPGDATVMPLAERLELLKKTVPSMKAPLEEYISHTPNWQTTDAINGKALIESFIDGYASQLNNMHYTSVNKISELQAREKALGQELSSLRQSQKKQESSVFTTAKKKEKLNQTIQAQEKQLDALRKELKGLQELSKNTPELAEQIRYVMAAKIT